MTRRSERTSELIKREISSLLERKINDPRLNELISVTEVTLSPDLKYAKVFVSILGNETNKKEVLEGFGAATGFLRREVASHLKLKYAPQLSFYYDDSIERGANTLKLMGQIGDDNPP
ncbi:MAG: 30S ribosome-binding factor RbfA [Chloroflexota bacterium]|nr:30S ribosome-binding factor RbfA [Chloroflexota bacterium]